MTSNSATPSVVSNLSDNGHDIAQNKYGVTLENHELRQTSPSIQAEDLTSPEDQAFLSGHSHVNKRNFGRKSRRMRNNSGAWSGSPPDTQLARLLADHRNLESSIIHSLHNASSRNVEQQKVLNQRLNDSLNQQRVLTYQMLRFLDYSQWQLNNFCAQTGQQIAADHNTAIDEVKTIMATQRMEMERSFLTRRQSND